MNVLLKKIIYINNIPPTIIIISPEIIVDINKAILLSCIFKIFKT